MIRFLSSTFFKKNVSKLFEKSILISSFLGVFVALIPFCMWWVNAIIIASIFILCFVSYYAVFFGKKKRVIACKNGISIVSLYGNILNVTGDNENKPIIVIPVNSAFDYLVEDSLSIEDPIVSGKSLHGKWIKYVTNDKPEEIRKLKNDIQKGISNGSLIKVGHIEKRGNKDYYELGSAIFVERENCTYMLFALTDFDKNNHVIPRHVGKYSDLISTLVKEMNRCQGRDVYIPIMGVGMSLFGLDNIGAYQIMKNTFSNNICGLKSSVYLMISDGDKDKVTIFD